jgi:methanogenic corrinoid protein MtbC1
MLLFENGHFLQTIEGPAESLQDIWASIKRDTRHAHIEVLSEHIARARLFSNWALLAEARAGRSPRPNQGAGKTATLVETYVAQVAELALNADDLGLNAIIASFADKGWSADAITKLLIEPAARALGDTWLTDECTEIDLTIALSVLQLAGHAVRHTPSAQAIRDSHYKVLLATAPGEKHLLGTSLLADQFFDHGWEVDLVFPESDEALRNQVSAQRPDALDIGLSDACTRLHALDRLRITVEQSRLSGLNHPTVISVGGRLFAEAAATAQTVGADHARTGLSGTSVRVAELVKRNRAS